MPVSINGNGAISGLVITTADLSDSSVTTAKIAADAVATVDIAANAVTVAKLAREGSSGQVLTSNGAGSDPSYQTISTTPTTAQVLSATAGASVGAVGTYATCVKIDSGGLAVGATVAGSSLRYAQGAGFTQSCGSWAVSNSGGGQPYSTTPSGTWRCMGFLNVGGTAGPTFVTGTTFLRIS